MNKTEEVVVPPSKAEILATPTATDNSVIIPLILDSILQGNADSLKNGFAYSPAFGFKATTSLELVENKGWSLDIGKAISTDFYLAGISKDINDMLDVSVGITSNLRDTTSGYAGFSVKF